MNKDKRITALESENSALTRLNELMEAEMKRLRVNIEALEEDKEALSKENYALNEELLAIKSKGFLRKIINYIGL